MKRNRTENKRERIKKRSEIDRVFIRGSKVRTTGCALMYMPNSFSVNRFAISVGRKFGNAVDRNRVKRHIREAYRDVKKTLSCCYDCIFIVYPGKTDFQLRKRQVTALLQKAGILEYR